MRFRIAILWLLLSATFLPADPAWWDARGVKTTDPTVQEENLAPATIGQAKHLAAMALAELEGKLPPSDRSGYGKTLP